MWPAWTILDWCQTIAISLLLAITIPFASYVYFKLLFSSPFSRNYTFKLIVVNGVAGIISVSIYLILMQLTSYHFMFNFYKFLEKVDLGQPIIMINLFFTGLNLNSTLFVALNRVKRIIMQRRNGNDSLFFLFSIVVSILLSLPGILDYAFFTKIFFVQTTLMDEEIMWPRSDTSNSIFLTISNILTIIVSVSTLIVNIVLVFITRKGKLMTRVGRSGVKQFNAEKGLIFTSAFSYVFQTLYLINRIFAQYFQIAFCAIAQFLFLGIARLSPVWCLIICAPSIRRSLFAFNTRYTVAPIQKTAMQMMLLTRAPRNVSNSDSAERIR